MKPYQATCAVLLSLFLTAAHAQDPHPHHPAPAYDGRAVLELTPEERAMLLTEMRLFLAGVQTMTAALGRQDMPAAAEAARGMGQKMVHEAPPALRAKLPLEFRQLGSSVHRGFDQIALDADSLQDVGTSLKQLSDTLKNCVACHATYQVKAPAHQAGH